MAGEWQKKTVDALKAETEAAIAIGPFGSRMKADRYTSSGVAVIRGNNLSDTPAFVGEFVYVSPETADELASCNVHGGDLVFPHRGAIGEVGIVPEQTAKRFILSTSLMKLTCNRKIVSPLFLYYFFRSPTGRYELLKNASTVGTPGIGQPLTSLKSIELLLPPMSEQLAIVEVLGKLDDKIELNRRMSETLEGMARALFKSWFVDFDPVRAKSEGRNTGLPNKTADGFPDAFEDSVIGKVPKSWSVGTLANFAELNPESWSKDAHPDEIEYVDLSNTKWGEIEATQRHTWAHAPSRAQRVLKPGDTIVGTVRPGNGSYALIGRSGLTGSTGFAVLRPRSPVFRELVYLAATAPESIERLSHLADGGAYPAVHPDVVVATQIPRPNDATVERFALTTAPLMSRIATNFQEARTLATLRNALLPKLISGELRLKDPARILGGQV